MKVVTYYRFSTDNAAQMENSEDRQEKWVMDCVMRNHWVVVGSYTDEAKSGAKDKPELMKSNILKNTMCTRKCHFKSAGV